MAQSSQLKTKSGFHPDPELSATLPGTYYYDPEIFGREREEIWFKTWQLAGYLGDLKEPGSYVTSDILGQKVFVVRARDGRLRAFYNVCMHRGHTLLEGKGNTRMITCPFHAWTYDLEGNLKAAGNSENVAGFDHDDFCLPEIRVEAFLNMAFVNLDADAPPLSSLMGGLEAEVRAVIPRFDDLAFGRSDPFDVRANWKFVFDQVECYHCPHLHPEVIKGKKFERRTSVAHEYYSSHVNPGDREMIDEGSSELPYAFSPDDELQDVHVWWMWPNMYLAAHQGPANFKIIRAVPVTPELTFETVDHFFLSDPPSAGETAIMDYFRDLVQPQDIGAMEGQQLGIHARGYKQGRLMVDAERSWRSEHIVHLFDNLVWTSLNGPNY